MICDILLQGINLRIEVDGEFHKGHRREEDIRKDELLLKVKGIRTIRLEAKQILKKPGNNYIMDMLQGVKGIEA